MKKVKIIAAIAVIGCIAVSCSNVDKVLKSNDIEAKYAAAMQYYDNNNYSKAIQIFENLTLYYRGKEHAEDIGWYYAQSLYKEKDYFTASYQFKRFARQFPYSDRVEEATYMAAYCKYLDSPVHSLDQHLTKEAIAEFESFAERWPRSLRMPQVNSYLDEMRAKLVKKDYEIAYGYYFIEEYHAAYESFKQFLNLYPEAAEREDAMFYMLRSGYLYADNSREEHRHERMQQVVNDFDRFASSFAGSKHMADAQDIYTRARAALAAMENKENKN